MAFRVLNQISSIRQITTKNFRSLSADRSSIIPITNNNGATVTEETPQQCKLRIPRRSLSQPPNLMRNYSSSKNEPSNDIQLPFLSTKEKQENDLGTARDKVKEELVQAVLSQQEYTQVVEKKPHKNDTIPRFILSCSEEKYNPDRLENINHQKTVSLVSYAKSKSSLQPNNMNQYSDVYKNELLKTLQQRGKPFIGVIGNSKRDFGTASTTNNTIENFNSDLIEETQRHTLKPHQDHIQNLLTTRSNELFKNTTDHIVNSINSNPKIFLNNTILENIQKRRISSFYDYDDPDCPRPRVKKVEQPKTCLTGKFVDKNPWPDCPPPPELKPPPLIPLPRIPKRPVPERRLVCPPPEVCPQRADVDFKVKEKTLPCLSLGNCPCVDPSPLKEGCPIPRLKKRPLPPPPALKCVPPELCPPRADDSYKIKMKELPCLVPGDCDCITAPLKEGSPLVRLKARPIPPPLRPKECIVEDPCPPRADAGLKIMPKKLRCLAPSECPCIEPPLRECNPLPRLKKAKVCEPIRVLNCTDENPCPERSDRLCNYKIHEKKLPTMIICQNHVSTWEFNHPPKRQFSSFAATNLLLREYSVEHDVKNMSRKYIEHICKANIAEKPIKNKPCEIFCPKLPRCAPKIRRLVKRKIDYITRKQDMETDCEPEVCERSDANTDFFKRKSLPVMECNNCPKLEPCGASTSQPLKRLVKRFNYSDPDRICHEGCDPEIRIDYHMPASPKKKLPILVPKCMECFEPHLPTCCPKLRRLVKRYSTDDHAQPKTTECQIEPCVRADLDGEIKKKKLPCLKPKCGIPPCEPMPSCSKLRKLKKRHHYKDEERVCEQPCDRSLLAADSLCGYEVKKKKLKPLLPCLPNALHQYRRFHTTAIRDRKHKSKKSGKKSECKSRKKSKSACISFKVNCPPRARKTCDPIYKFKDCQKQNSPYKSFAECANHDIIETITECPKVNYLQPRYPIIAPITVLKAPPPKHAHIDPKEEEMCIMKKLCMENKGVTYDCDSFNKPKYPLRQMDVQGPERVPCPDPIEEDLKKSRKQKHRPCKEVEPKCPEVSYKICENDVCSKPKPASEEKQECQPEEKCETQSKEKEPKSEVKDDSCKEEIKSQDVVKCEEANIEEAKKEDTIKCETVEEKKIDVCKDENESKNEICSPPQGNLCYANAKTISPSSIKPKCKTNEKSHCDLMKPLKDCEKSSATKKTPKPIVVENCGKSQPTLLDKFINYFRARPDCPSPDDWKKRQLLEQAEKAAKAVGMELCKPKSTSMGKCKSFKAPESPKTKCPTAEEVCKQVCENALKQHLAKKASSGKQKSDCMSKCNYSKSAKTASVSSDGSKKCKVPMPDCGQKVKESKKAKKDDYKRESKPSCGNQAPSCGTPPTDPCHIPRYHNCPKKVERPCVEPPVIKDCCYIRPPYACFSDMQTRFPRLHVSECQEQEARIRAQRDNPIRPQNKKKKEPKEDPCRRNFSTYPPTRSFSTSKPKPILMEQNLNEFVEDYYLCESLSNEIVLDEFGELNGLAEYEDLFYES